MLSWFGERSESIRRLQRLSEQFDGQQSPAGRDPLERTAGDLLLLGLAALIRAGFGYPPYEAVPYLRESAWQLGILGAGDPERLHMISWKWAAAEVVPSTAEQDRQCVSDQVAELVPGWFS